MKRILSNLILIIIVIQFLPLSVIAQDDVTNKLMMGYQGWFLAKGDNAPADRWVHWFNSSSDPSASQIGIDYWPAMDEYPNSYDTKMTYLDGSTAKLFSSYDSSTTNVHFKWMRDYNIHGVYLQRFLGAVTRSKELFETRNGVLQNVIGAAKKYGRQFAVMYDISGVEDQNVIDWITTDWEYLVDTYDVMNQENYVYQDNRPVLAIWGIGFKDRGLQPSTFETLLDYFESTADEKYRAFIMGGVPSGWGTLSGDSESDPAWANVYKRLDMVSPWTVGRYNNQSGIDNWKTSKIIPDLNKCETNGNEYMPVIWPGFSWKNIHDGPLNQIPRDGGKYFWKQAYNVVDAGAKFIYVAMFDEVDEGTAMFKMAENKSQVPLEIQNRIVTLDEDGYDLPSDWYLRLAGEAQKMLDGTIFPTSIIPITPYPSNFREIISYCDRVDNWSSDNNLTVNKLHGKRGIGSLQSIGDGMVEFSRNFLTPFAIGTSTSIGFWYYVSDVSKLDDENQVELGSGGKADLSEWNWTLNTDSLKNGWNYIKLDFDDATSAGGGASKYSINWFRIYHKKNDVVTTMIDDIKFIGADGVSKPIADAGINIVRIDNNDDGKDIVLLDASGSIDFDGTIDQYIWKKDGVEIGTSEKLVEELEVGSYLIHLTVIDNDGLKDECMISITVKSSLDDCDVKTGWKSENQLTVNNTAHKKGNGALQAVGNSLVDFEKLFVSPVSADSSTAISFWYYVADTAAFNQENQVELGSGGEADVNEYSWSLSGLQNGWNYIILLFADATVSGGEPNTDQLNWFRIYREKNASATTMIDDIKFRGNSGNLKPLAAAGKDQTVMSDSTSLGTVTLDGSGSFDIDGTIESYVWTEDNVEIATGVNPVVKLTEGLHIITLTITDNSGDTNSDDVTIKVDGDYFDDCDSKDGWDGSNNLSINMIDHQQGGGCLEAVGSGTDDFKKVLNNSVNASAHTAIEFWYYVSDVSLLQEAGQVELSSGKRNDQNELNWKMPPLENGWNQIKLNFADAGITGGDCDLTNVNFFRLYRFKNETVTSRIDGIKFTGVNLSPIAVAGPDQVVIDNDDDGKESIVLDGSGSSDSDGSVVSYSWVENGNEIATGVNPTVELAVGEHIITLKVTDNGSAIGEDEISVVVEEFVSVDEENAIPKKYGLNQNYPNPFNPTTTIRYALPKSGFVKLIIYDILGKEVATLVNQIKQAGYHNVELDAHGMASGIYLYRIQCNDFVKTKKLILLK